MKPVSAPLQVLRLSLQDLMHDRWVSLCILASLVAVIVPVLLLLGLRLGVVANLQQQLLTDPVNLELKIINNARLDRAWFEQVGRRADVAFVIPLTRSLNTQASVRLDAQRFIENMELLPTATGDPLLKQLPVPELGQTVLSRLAADRLAAKVGDEISVRINRRRDGLQENGKRSLVVSAILSPAVFPRAAMLVNLSFLESLEDFRDGYQSPEWGLDSGDLRPARQDYARARVYARSLEQVAELARWLESKSLGQQTLNVSTRVNDIEAVQSIDAVLNLIFLVVAGTAIAGAAASLFAAFLTNIDRKRRYLAYFRLLGLGTGAVASFVLIQALLLSLFAFALGGLGYQAGSEIFNQVLGQALPDSQFVCRLQSHDVVLALSFTLVLALLVAGLGSVRAMRIEAVESLREG